MLWKNPPPEFAGFGCGAGSGGEGAGCDETGGGGGVTAGDSGWVVAVPL